MVGDLPLTGGGHAAQLEKMRLCECRGRSVWNGTYGCAPISHVTTPLVRSTLLLVRLPLKETDPSLEVPPVPLGVRWKFRPFARLPKRVHSVGRKSKIVVEIVDLRSVTLVLYVVLKFHAFKKNRTETLSGRRPSRKSGADEHTGHVLREGAEAGVRCRRGDDGACGCAGADVG